MAIAGVFVALVLAVLTAILLALGVAALIGLIRGYFELRRLVSAGSDSYISLLLKSPLVPGISVVYAPPDASAESRATLRRMLDLHYGNHEAVLVADVADIPVWTQEFHLVERDPGRFTSTDPIKLYVVAMPKESEAAMLNVGIQAARYPWVSFVDNQAEFVPEQLLLQMIRPALENPDEVLAVSAMAPPAPAHGLAGAIGGLEAARVWLVRCASFTAWNKLMPVPGSSMLVRRDFALEAGGIKNTPSDLFERIPAGKRAAFLPRRVSWLPAPRTWAELRAVAQRDQREMNSQFRAGREGRALFAIRVLRPLLETIALVFAVVGVAVGWVGWPTAGLVLLSTAVVGMITSMAALVLREFADATIGEPAQLAFLFAAAIVENLGYRQVRNLWLIAASFR